MIVVFFCVCHFVNSQEFLKSKKVFTPSTAVVELSHVEQSSNLIVVEVLSFGAFIFPFIMALCPYQSHTSIIHTTHSIPRYYLKIILFYAFLLKYMYSILYNICREDSYSGSTTSYCLVMSVYGLL